MSSLELAKEMEAKHPNLYVLKYRALEPLLIKMRDRTTTHMQFKHYADRLMSILAEEGLASCASTTTTIVTPTGDSVTGVAPAESVCAVSIIRAGCSLLHAAISCDPTIAVAPGHVLLEAASERRNVRERAGGRSNARDWRQHHDGHQGERAKSSSHPIIAAFRPHPSQTLLAAGVDENRITFLNVLACPEGLAALFSAHPNVKVVTAGVDRGLNEAKYLVPGIGDFGDRYFNTVHSHYP
ncbi:hypothetical protein ON010_g17599 [Phytophthora cinnamomi]|nr:hypothetical protein ON010_g17599 [Phytophthora cinnamomi]